MLLGIVLHASLPYFSRIIGIESFWPADDDQSALLFVVFDFVHAWRMPTFFLLAGFFAHLVLARRPVSTFVIDRLKRIALPLVLFGAVMAVIIPPIWIYGWSGFMSVEAFQDVLGERLDLNSSGDLVAHLWFLYYLLLMYGALTGFRLLGRLIRSVSSVGLAGRPPLGRYIEKAVYTRLPLLLTLAAVLLLVVRAGNESKPIWPPNVPDLLYAGIFFFYGHGLWSRRELLDGLRGRSALAGLWTAGMLAYAVHVAALGVQDQGLAGTALGIVTVVDTLAYGSAAVLLSIALVGSFEAGFRAPRRWVRWMADSSYWIYLMHLPVVAFLTFWLAHLDASGRLTALTGFRWGAELKFSIAFVATSAVGVVTYRYLVRYTPLGTLLNGKREKPAARVPS